jgi:hypothetical protein
LINRETGDWNFRLLRRAALPAVVLLACASARSTCTYRQAVTLFTEEMGYSKQDQEWIMGRGLAECLPWPIK